MQEQAMTTKQFDDVCLQAASLSDEIEAARRLPA